MLQANRNILEMNTCVWLPPSKLTSFTHHRGDKLGDDGAPLPHLTLLAVGEVGEDARDTSCTRCPARVHHDQHLHYGGVHISDTAEGQNEKTGGEDESGTVVTKHVKWARCFRGKLCWNFQWCVCSVLLGHCLDHKDVFASHRLLDLYPCFYGNKQDMRRRGAARTHAHLTQTRSSTHSYLITKPPRPVSFIRGLSEPFVPVSHKHPTPHCVKL